MIFRALTGKCDSCLQWGFASDERGEILDSIQRAVVRYLMCYFSCLNVLSVLYLLGVGGYILLCEAGVSYLFLFWSWYFHFYLEVGG